MSSESAPMLVVQKTQHVTSCVRRVGLASCSTPARSKRVLARSARRGIRTARFNAAFSSTVNLS
eukprot:CAMPEP_0194549182 /NCGR_PEP_ID=MMETSP0253-20130528/94853_1 /TAXON_ID=2966 /ORGANISM="Noctiluca scintillans" /LENGTH=63 /DNA_ID=CAMNT_0039396589 /DNA_START=53 /DNA_END=241 /DNA_ORIENTATION=-